MNLILILLFTQISFLNANALDKNEEDYLKFFKVTDQKTKEKLKKIKTYVLNRKKELLKLNSKEAKFTIEEIDVDLKLMNAGFNPYKMSRQEKVNSLAMVKKLIKEKKSGKKAKKKK